MHKFLPFAIVVFFLAGCSEEEKTKPIQEPEKPTEKKKPIVFSSAPDFNADSAYNYIAKQVSFGPRVPNTKEHLACSKYLADKLKSFGFETITQEAQVTSFNNKKLNIKNIIGQWNKDKSRRILLFAHWDTRPFADRDDKDQNKPILGANDGGSGVGVLLEIARQLNEAEVLPQVGIDIIFFDAEDYGQPNGTMIQKQDGSWCLGSQYWAKNIHTRPYQPMYGILLDMVGAKNAVFPKEATSMYYASQVVEKVWSIAQQSGYGRYFINRETYGGITDDHVYVSQIAGIPSIDIIHYDPNQSDFGHFHHTHKDNMEIIDRETLKAVGQTVLNTIYSES